MPADAGHTHKGLQGQNLNQFRTVAGSCSFRIDTDVSVTSAQNPSLCQLRKLWLSGQWHRVVELVRGDQSPACVASSVTSSESACINHPHKKIVRHKIKGGRTKRAAGTLLPAPGVRLRPAPAGFVPQCHVHHQPRFADTLVPCGPKHTSALGLP